MRVLLILILILSLSNCKSGSDARKIPPNVKDRQLKNIEEGRGFRLTGSKKNTGEFDFASSNELWRATLDTLDFMVISSVDYAGGLIISDWYSDNNPNEAIKITVRFLANEVRVDSLKISVHKKTCVNSNCLVKQIDTDLTANIREKILKKAAILTKTAEEKKKKKKFKSVISNERF